MQIAEAHHLIWFVHIAAVHFVENGSEGGDVHFVLAIEAEGQAFEIGSHLRNMLIILERQLLDIAAALGEDGDKAVLFKTLDGFTHRRARAVVVD